MNKKENLANDTYLSIVYTVFSRLRKIHFQFYYIFWIDTKSLDNFWSELRPLNFEDYN